MRTEFAKNNNMRDNQLGKNEYITHDIKSVTRHMAKDVFPVRGGRVDTREHQENKHEIIP